MSGDVLVRVLGPIGARVNGAPADLGGRRQRALLAGLAIDADRVVSADQLIERVWPDGEGPSEPRPAIHTYMSRLRRALGANGAIATEASGWRLDASMVQLDARRFAELVSGAEEPGIGVHRRLSLLDEALGLWEGDAYDEVAAEPWALAEADRLNELRVTAIERRFDAMLTAGMHTDALPGLTAEADAHPYRDRLVGLQMLALFRSGRQAEATRVYQAHRARLADELGLEPGAELSELDRRIVAADPDLLQPSQTGRPLRGYLLGEQVGEGAFAVVYRGTQPSVGRDVAVKVIRAQLANRPEFVRRFEAEAHLVARLEHPYIVPLYDYWREPDRACLVFRYLRGGTLEARLTAAGGLGAGECLTMVDEVGSALATAHQAGVVHRDVKPANVLLDEAGNFYLGDFGIALEATELSDPTAALSAGSPAYASPEQLRREPIGPSADVHGLGITIYEALTGRLPFPEAATQAELLQRQLNEPIPPIGETRPELPPGIDVVLSRATAKDPAARYQHIEELVADFRAALDAGPDRQPARRGVATSIASTGEARNPYKGLRPFTEADSSDFHGRERLVDRLLEVLRRTGTPGRIAAVVGPSGIGKSSVVRAGLLPALRAGAVPGSEKWFIATMLPGTDPFDELASALIRIATHTPANIRAQLAEDGRGIARVVKGLVPEGGETDVLLVIDQFEELFTLVEDDRLVRLFLDSLEHAITDARCRFRVVLTMRADFWDRPLRHGSFARLIEDSTVNVTALAPDELERVITEPSHRVGCEFEPGLVSEITADVADQPGALPMLQYALTELWERRISGLLTRDAYREMGGVAGALTMRAEGLFEAAGDGEQAASRRIFGRLVTLGEGTEDTRRRAMRRELAVDAQAEAAIDAYGRARLLSFDTDPSTSEPTVEVAHEALIRQWPRLRSWLDDDRDGLRMLSHLRSATAAWIGSDRDPGELYRGGRLDVVEGWAVDHPNELTGEESAFLEASIEQRVADEATERARLDEQVRSNRRLRVLLAGVAALLMVAMVVGVFALRERSRADGEAVEAANQAALARTNEAEAERQAADAAAARRTAETERVAATAAATVTEDRQLALLLAAEAHRREPGLATVGGLQRVLSRTGSFLGVVASGHPTSGLAWTADDVIVASGPTGVRFVDAASGAELGQVETAVAQWNEAGFGGRTVAYALSTVSADGRLLAMVPADTRDVIQVRTIPGGEMVAQLEHETDVDQLVFVAEDRRLATMDDGGWLRLFDAATWAEVSAKPAHTEPTLGHQPIPDDLRYFFDEDGTGPSRNWPVGTLQSVIRELPDGLLLTSRGHSTKRWDAIDGSPGPEMRPPAVEFQGMPGAAFASEVHPVDGRLVEPIGSFVTVRDYESQEALGQYQIPGSNAIGGAARLVDSAIVGNGGMWSLLTDGQLLLIDAITGEQLRPTTVVELSEVAALRIDPRGTRMAVAGNEGVIVLSTDGRQLIAGATPRAGTDLFFLVGEGEHLLRGFNGLEGYDGPPLLNLSGSVAEVSDVRYEGERNFLAEGGRIHLNSGGDIGLGWSFIETATGEQLMETSLPPGLPAKGLAHSSDMRFVAIGAGGTLWVHDLTDQVTVAERDFEAGVYSTVSFSPDGSRLLVAWEAGPPELLAVPSMESLDHPLPDDTSAARWAEDGSWLFVVDGNRQVWLHDPQTLLRIRPLAGSLLPATEGKANAFSVGDGSIIVSEVANQPQLFDASSGRPIGGVFPIDRGYRMDGIDGPPLAVTAVGEHILLWNLDVETWPEIACRAAGRNMTPDEWEQFGPQDEPYRPTCAQWLSLD